MKRALVICFDVALLTVCILCAAIIERSHKYFAKDVDRATAGLDNFK